MDLFGHHKVVVVKRNESIDLTVVILEAIGLTGLDFHLLLGESARCLIKLFPSLPQLLLDLFEPKLIYDFLLMGGGDQATGQVTEFGDGDVGLAIQDIEG